MHKQKQKINVFLMKLNTKKTNGVLFTKYRENSRAHRSICCLKINMSLSSKLPKLTR